MLESDHAFDFDHVSIYIDVDFCRKVPNGLNFDSRALYSARIQFDPTVCPSAA